MQSHVDFSLREFENQLLKPTTNSKPVTQALRAAQLAQKKPGEVKVKALDLEIGRSSSFMPMTRLAYDSS